MSTRRRILLLLMGVMVLAIAFYISRPQEPVYQGVPLSGWLKQLAHPQDWPQRERAEEAIWQIGTNAVPYLLEVLRKSDAPFKVRSINWLEKKTHMDLDRFRATDRQIAAVAAIQVLGPRFRPWLPELAAMAVNKDPNVSDMSLWILGLTRCEETVPILTSALTNGLANTPWGGCLFCRGSRTLRSLGDPSSDLVTRPDECSYAPPGSASASKYFSRA